VWNAKIRSSTVGFGIDGKPRALGRGRPRKRSECGRSKRSIKQFIGQDFKQRSGKRISRDIRHGDKVPSGIDGTRIYSGERGGDDRIASSKPGPK
jgi:hypothetical protein